MVRPNEKRIDDCIVPLNMNGLQGRMLRLPVPLNKKREVLFVYDRRSSLERWWPLAKELNHYAGVTMPDLPGFGGMQSLYRMGEKPTLDALADYLAAFVKLRYKRRRLTIIGWGFGFLVATRMLQRYPDIAKKVDVLVSIAGYAHHDDFQMAKSRRLLYWLTAGLFSQRLPAWILQRIGLQPIVLQQVYSQLLAPPTSAGVKKRRQYQKAMAAEIWLWHVNDIRTFMLTARAMLAVDNCQLRLDLPVWQINAPSSKSLNSHLVEQHLKVIFSEVQQIDAEANWYSPLVNRPIRPNAHMPSKLRRLLTQPA